MKTKGTVSGICLLLKGFLDATMTESVMVPDANLVNRSWSPPPDRHCQLSLPLFAETARMHAHIQQNPIDSLGCCVSAAATLWEPCLINLLKSMQVQVICFYVFPDHTFFAWRSPEKHMSELLLNAKLLWCAAWFSRQAAPCAGFNGLCYFSRNILQNRNAFRLGEQCTVATVTSASNTIMYVLPDAASYVKNSV